MTLVGIPVEQQDACFRMVAAVLHMGNLEFADGAEEDSSQLAPAAAKHLDACAMLLGVQPDGLLKALTTRTRQTVDGQWPHSLLVVKQTLHWRCLAFAASTQRAGPTQVAQVIAAPVQASRHIYNTSHLRLCRPHCQPH
jgi:Myosin head (motor domain)